MELDLLKGHLRDYVESITQKSKSGLYVCPICGSGTGKNGTGAFGIYSEGLKWKCQACGRGGDLFDLIGEIEGIADQGQQFKRAGELFGVPADATRREYQNQDKNEQHTQESIHTSVDTPAEDYTDFLLEAHTHIGETDYLTKRGLSQETIDRFKLGYLADYHAHNKGAWGWDAVIIPTSRHSYVIRNTNEQADKDHRYRKQGKNHYLNERALQTAEVPIFITEGDLDAISIMDVGGTAVSIGSASNAPGFADYLKVRRPAQPLILALDNDKTGDEKTLELEQKLTEYQIPYYRINIYGECKDANEALQKDREAFRQAVERAEQIQEEAERALREEYLQTSSANHIQAFIDGIADSVNTSYIPTGFSKLDAILDGGLYEGLYIIGAISSLGKTTLITQIADQIAQRGQDVLIFSLEMARSELMAKSISRHTLQTILSAGGDIRNAKTTRGITVGKRYQGYNKDEIGLINSSVMEYSKYAQHIYISEGIGNIGAEQVRETVQRHIRFTGNTPVIVIDYLQILAPADVRATDKQNMDKAVLELKRISRDYKAVVLGISSLNRANYHTPISMEAFKESGAIEYSSDILIGLQLKGVGTKDFNVDEAKKKNPREIELVVLKNRNGSTGDKLGLAYYPMFNCFMEE